MQNQSNVLRKVKDFFLPPDKTSWNEFKEVVPFFALMTIALGWLYIVFSPMTSSLFWRITFTIIMLIHLILYWSVFNFVGSETRTTLYFIIQGILAIILVSIVGDEGLLIGLFGSLIGNSFGVLKGKKTFIVVFLYLVAAVLGMLYLTNAASLLSWASIAIPSMLFAGFIAYLFRRQLEAKQQAQDLLTELQAAHKQLEAYTEQVEELTLSAERQRMARELHDTLAQGLAGLILKLEAVSTHMQGGNTGRAQEILQDAMAQSRTTLSEARMVIDDLRSDTNRQSLDEAVRAEVRRFEALSDIPCEVVLQHPSSMVPQTREHVLKIISEGLNNIAKHAGASQAWLRVIETKDGCKIEIEDDGRGFVVDDALTKEGSYGLLGIRERAELLHGTVQIDSAPGDGLCLTVLIPKNGRENEHA